jgi:hypothetical protein
MAKGRIKALEDWKGGYEAGVTSGAQRYQAKIPTMTSVWGDWADMIYNDVIAQQVAIQAIPKVPDRPDLNWVRRGLPFVNLMKRKKSEFARAKLVVRRAIAPTLPTAPTVVVR